MRSTARAPTPRRTQAERREGTRRKLLDATVACLTDLGYAGTTTTAVCSHAGVSQGALFKHFPTKVALVSAAAEYLFTALVDQYRAEFPNVATKGDRIEGAVRLLWKVMDQPHLHAAFELYLAARTDAELAASLRPVALKHRRNLQQQARDLFPQAAEAGEDFDVVLGILIDAMQGAAIGGTALRDERRSQKMLRFLIEFTHTELARLEGTGSRR
jgi:AcrR family transcriptional regulator